MRQVTEKEVFPNQTILHSERTSNISRFSMFDLGFYPEEPGPYNYDVDPMCRMLRQDSMIGGKPGRSRITVGRNYAANRSN